MLAGQKCDPNMARDKVVDRLPGTTIGHMIQLDTGDLREPLRHEMLLRTYSRSRIAHFRPHLCNADQFSDRVHTKCRMSS